MDRPKPEKNSFGLPAGEPIRRELVRSFRRQRREILAGLGGRKDDAATPLPARLPDFRLGALRESERFTPLLEVLWEDGGRAAYSRLGLDPDKWEVVNPHTRAMIQGASLAFCKETAKTTSLQLDEALKRTRAELSAGVVDRGESIPKLTRRVNIVFDGAEAYRARSIAQSEASRAVHAAQAEAARRSGIVAGFEWLTSSDACPLCLIVAEKARYVRLGTPFAVVGDNPAYMTVEYPPLHPHCNCSMQEVLDPAISNEPAPEWADTLIQPGRGTEGPEPAAAPTVKPRKPGVGIILPAAGLAVGVGVLAGPTVYRLARRLVAGPKPAAPTPTPTTSAGLIPPGPIAERIKAYMEGAGAAKLGRLAGLDATYRRELEDLEDARQRAAKEFDRLRRKKGYVHQETRDVDARLQEVTERIARYKDAARGTAYRVVEALTVPAASRAHLDTRMVTAGRAVPPVTREAEGWLGAILAAEPSAPKGIKVEYGALRKASDRAYYTDKDRRINLSGAEPATTVVHEYGHAIEHQWANVGKLSAEFLDYRVGPEKIEKLRHLFPKRGYGPEERGRKDRFDEVFGRIEAFYVGKEYRQNVRKASTRYGTEILSMGVEKLLTDPVTFAKKDPEFCAYVLGVLDGSLR